MQGASNTGRASSVRADEVALFNRLAARWWDPAGPAAPLHAMNPLRVGWIDRRIPRGARILDVGCGAGLASEALARLGHAVMGLDAAADIVAAAWAHASGQDLALAYRVGAAEDLVAEGHRFQVITALEVIEHVADPAAFMGSLAALLEPDGRLFVSTINRTTRSLVVAKLGAEYVVRALPVGTHDWRRFVPPTELRTQARAAGLHLTATSGMSYAPFSREWRESRNLAMNYIAMLTTTPHPGDAP